MLFDDFPRDDLSIKRANESSYDFINRSARPEIDRVRTMLNVLLNEIPIRDQTEIASRIKSRRHSHFASSVFELFLHGMLLRLGFSLEPHPKLKNGSEKRPDFLVNAPNGEEFYLEAVLAAEKKEGDDDAAEAMKNTTLDALHKGGHHFFFVDIRSQGAPTTQPSGRKLRADILRWLNTLNVDDIQILFATQPSELPRLQWQHEDWRLTIKPLPISAERRGRATTMMGIYGAGAGWVNAWEPLKGALKEKGGRYGKLDLPLIVAVNVESFGLNPIDELQALFGQEKIVISANTSQRDAHLQRAPNGIWLDANGAAGTRISGAWIFDNINLYNLASRRQTLYVHPWPELEVPVSMLCFPHARLTPEGIQHTPGITVPDIFNIPKTWPL